MTLTNFFSSQATSFSSLALLSILGSCDLALGGGSGPTWFEVGDAPEGIPQHQVTVGTQPQLMRIFGTLNRSAGDHVDTYCIVVTDPEEFIANGYALDNFGGPAPYQARMYLWTLDGDPLLGNEDQNFQDSLLSDPDLFASTGGTVSAEAAGVSLQAGQIYLLSITTQGNDPLDSSGNPVIDIAGDTGKLEGPSATAGDFAAWANDASQAQGTYRIDLAGAEFSRVVPEPSTIAMPLAITTALAYWRRRR